MKAALALLAIGFASSAFAQDTTSIMMQQQATMQHTQEANQIAAQAAQQANDQMMQTAQQANQDAMRAQQGNTWMSTRGWYPAATPELSIHSGIFPRPITVKIKTGTRGAIIYYTSNGQTPTTASLRYAGPIAISSTTTLRAMAVAPGFARSRVVVAIYRIDVP